MIHKQHHYSKRTVDVCDMSVPMFIGHQNLRQIKKKLSSHIITHCIFWDLLQILRWV